MKPHWTEWSKDRWFTLSLFAFVAFAFLLLAYRTERADDQIRRVLESDRQQQVLIQRNFSVLSAGLRANCRAREANTARFNHALEAAVLGDDAIRNDPDKRSEALKRIEPFKLAPDDCSRYP